VPCLAMLHTLCERGVAWAPQRLLLCVSAVCCESMLSAGMGRCMRTQNAAFITNNRLLLCESVV
jgi:hypothetical protein